MQKLIVFGCLTATLPLHAIAAEPLEKQVVRRIVTDSGDYVIGGGRVARVQPPPDMTNTLVKLSSIDNLSVAASNVKYDSSAMRKVNESAEVKYERHVNCTGQVQLFKKEITVSVVIGQTVVITEGRTSTSSASVDVTVPFGADGSIGANTSRVIQVNLSSDTTKTNTLTDSETLTIERQVQPYTALWVEAKRRKNTIQVPFTADFIVDGDVVIGEYRSGGFSVNRHGYRVSQKLPSESARTFFGAGHIENISAETLDIQLVEQKLDRSDPRACPAIPGIGPPPR